MSNVHPTAVVDPAAQLGEGVTVGPLAVIGPHVKLGAGTTVMAHGMVDGHTTLGEQCHVFPYACIGMRTQDLKDDGKVSYVEVGDRTVMRECVTINSGTFEGETTRVGSDCLIMAYCHVAHGCRIGNHVIMSNSSQLAGEVDVADGAIIAGVVGIHQFSRVGTMAMVGGASKIQQDCPPYMITDGNPAAVRGLNSIGLKRAQVGPEARSALKQAFRLLHREGLATTTAIERIRAELTSYPELEHLIEFYENSERGVTR